MVLIIENWGMFLDHLDRSKGIGLYQIVGTGVGVMLRVRAGTLGYEEKFESEEDGGLKGKLKVLEAKSLLKVARIVEDDAFFM